MDFIYSKEIMRLDIFIFLFYCRPSGWFYSPVRMRNKKLETTWNIMCEKFFFTFSKVFKLFSMCAKFQVNK